MDKIIEILQKYEKPTINMWLIAGLIVVQLLQWTCLSEVRDEQLRRATVIDVVERGLHH